MWKEYLAATLISLTCTSLLFIFIYLWIPSLPRKQRVFIEQCWRRLRPMFTDFTELYKNKDKTIVIAIPNAIIVFCFVVLNLGFVLGFYQNL
jgi:hypothetical protein